MSDFGSMTGATAASHLGPQQATAPPVRHFDPAQPAAELIQACYRDTEKAQKLHDHLVRVRLSADAKDAVSAMVPDLLRRANDDSIHQALDLIDGRTDALEEFKGFQSLLESSSGVAVEDLKLLQAMSGPGRTPFAELLGYACAMRGQDNRSYRDKVPDIQKPLAWVVQGADAKARADRMAALSALRVGSRTTEDALAHQQHLEALKAPPEQRSSIREAYVKLLSNAHNSYDDALLQALDAVSGRPQAAAEFQAFVALDDASSRPPVATDDLKALQKIVGQNGLTLEEAQGYAVAIRSRDPARNSYNAKFAAMEEPLAWIAAGPDAASRQARAETLSKLQVSGRNIQQALAHQQHLEAMKAPAAQQQPIHELYVQMLGKYYTNYDDALMRGLDLASGRPDPLAEVQGFASLAEASGRPEVAAQGLQAIQKVGLPLQDAVGFAKDMLEKDPARNSYNKKFADVAGALDYVAQGRDAADRQVRANRLGSFQSYSRNVEQALEHARHLDAIQASATAQAALELDYGKLLTKYYSSEDPHLLRVLDLLKGRPDPPAELQAFSGLADASGHPAVAADDLALLQKSKVPRDEVVGYLVDLRNSDPAKGRYDGKFADLSQPMEWILGAPDASARAARHVELKSFMAYQRNPEVAFRHADRIHHLQGSAADLQAVGATYAGFLKNNYSGDEAFLKMLDRIDRRPDMVAACQSFHDLLGVVTDAPQALSDFDLVEKTAAAHQVSQPEATGLAVRVRQADPALHSYHAKLGDLAPALDWMLSAPDAGARNGRTDAILQCHAGGRSVAEALPHAQKLELLGLPPDGQKAYVEALGSCAASADAHLLAALDAVKLRPDPAGEVKAFADLVKARPDAEEALSDLRTLQQAAARYNIGVAEALPYARELRAAEPSRGWRQTEPVAPIDDPLKLVLGATTPEAREERARSIVELSSPESSVSRAAEDVQWLLADGRSETLARKTGGFHKMRNLARVEQRGAAFDLYEKLQAGCDQEHQGWLARLLHLRKPFQKMVDKLIKHDLNVDHVLLYLEGIEKGRWPEESRKQATRRMVRLIDAEGSYHPQAMRDVFIKLLEPLPWGNLPPPEKWQQLQGLVKETGSAGRGATVYSAMAQAADEKEAFRRKDAFATVLEMAQHQYEGAGELYEAAMIDVGPHDALQDRLPALRELMAGRVQPSMAAAQYRASRVWKDLPPDEQGTLLGLLVGADTPDLVDGIVKRCQQPIAGEGVMDRARILHQMRQHLETKHALQAYDTMAEDLKSATPFGTVGEAYAGLVTVAVERLGVEGASRSRDLLQWLREERTHNEHLKDLPLENALMDLGQRLLLTSDVEEIQKQFLAGTEAAWRAGHGEGPGGVEVGQTEAIVAGVRVPIRPKNSPPT